ncbi:sensor domain-containing protein [Mycobacterium ostraviense]|uniref:sensor domain-containing protein n=1 Tax=Mycobacterium ostraviense TaxID=2738409 RepID=UPI00137AA96A|nr:sensor domain-containing protein [Mycobacterium ostraviense]UGT93764.1 sensor domain-containing protein [Mycobacterium ostraviense]
MSDDVDPRSPGPQPNPFDVGSEGSATQPQGATDVEPTEPVPEYFSAANGPPLPPVIEAFPGYHDVQQPPKKVTKKVFGKVFEKLRARRAIRWPAIAAIGAASVAVILVVVTITVLLTNRRGPKPGHSAAPPAPSAVLPPSTSPPPPLTTPEQLDGILLSAADINAVMGASTMETMETGYRLDPTPIKLSHPECQGALYAVQDLVYAGSGQTALRVQLVYEPGRYHAHWVTQAAVTFPSADKAHQFVQNSADKWKSCANQTVSATNTAGNTVKWTLASLNGEPPTITLSELQLGASNNWGCQRALSAVSNVVIDVNACGYRIADEGRQLADKMVAKVQRQ